jgi:hypothetical protein
MFLELGVKSIQPHALLYLVKKVIKNESQQFHH